MSPKARRADEPEMVSDTFDIYRRRDTYAREVSLHHHDFYEVYFFESGDLDYIIEGRTYELRPRDILLISPTELHQPLFRDPHQVYARTVLFLSRRFLESMCSPGQELDACFDTAAPGHTNRLRPDREQAQRLEFLLSEILRERAVQEEGSELYAVACMAQVLIQLNRLARRGGRDAAPKPAHDPLVNEVLDYINEHYAEELPLDELSQKFFISKYHLSREFKRLCGVPVHRYLTQKRLAVAKQLMADGASSFDAYQRSGFGDYSSFYRAFRAEYGITPKAYTHPAPLLPAPLPAVMK